MAAKCDIASSSLQYLIERYPALLIIIITCIPLYSFTASCMPTVRYKHLEAIYKDVSKFHAEGVKEGLLDDCLSSAVSDELLIRHVLLVSRYLEASKYRWFPKTMLQEFVGGFSIRLYQCEMELRGAHALLAVLKADALKKRRQDGSAGKYSAV